MQKYAEESQCELTVTGREKKTRRTLQPYVSGWVSEIYCVVSPLVGLWRKKRRVMFMMATVDPIKHHCIPPSCGRTSALAVASFCQCLINLLDNSLMASI